MRISQYLFAPVMAFTALSALAGPVSVSINSAQTSLKASDNVNVSVTISNTSSRPVRVLKWYTPVNDVEEALFDIKRDGADVPYLGAHYKRPAPLASDYMTLKA